VESGVSGWYDRTGWWTELGCRLGGKEKRKAYAEGAEFAEKSGEEGRGGGEEKTG
jgi:hypothetical protein